MYPHRWFPLAAHLAISLSLALAACASVEYTPPTAAEPPPLELGIEAPFPEVWSRLGAYLERRKGDLAIKRMERDLGQVEIGFGPVPPGTYAECGYITRSSPDYSGPFTGFLTEHAEGKLHGEVKVRAHRGEEALTRVTIHVSYVLTAVGSSQDYSMAFNSTAPAQLRVGRSCRSNYELERNVIKALRGI